MSAAKNTDEPAPPAPRRATKAVKLGAVAASSDDTPTMAAPAVTMARSPNRRVSEPETRSNSRRVKANADARSPTAPYPTPNERA